MELVKKKIKEIDMATYNPRRIKKEALKGLEKSIERFGYVEPIILNRRTNRIVGGHQRLKVLKKKGYKEVEVVEVDLSEIEEKALNITLNNNKIQGDFDDQQLEELLLEIQNFDSFKEVHLDKLIQNLIEEGEIEDNVSELISSEDWKKDLPSTVFSSTNSFGIPDLKENRQIELLHFPVKIWGWGKDARSNFQGTYLFYTDDYRFEMLWDDPRKIINTGAANVAEINFSCVNQMPRVVVLWNIYKKRWISRYLQERGLRIAVDLFVSKQWYEDNLLGVPKGWNCYITKGTAGTIEGGALKEQYELALEHFGGSPKDLNFYVYDGNKKVKDFCNKNKIQYIPNFFSPGWQEYKKEKENERTI